MTRACPICGPQALKNLLIALNADPAKIKMLEEARSGPDGFNLEQVARLAAGFDSKLVYRAPEQPIPVPSIVNWKIHHYAAVVGEQDGLFHVEDPTFGGGDLWITKAAIDSEASGYFLVPAELEEAQSWPKVGLAEARQVFTGWASPAPISRDPPRRMIRTYTSAAVMAYASPTPS
jgi:ABC-type bacteriocin/lantibiotic exporter with double-glycine peptidase domain